ncbi:MAG: hypothetical protein IKU27_03790 [Clostridia bacterium]|nr:hypothetical protein [Clostridia bacterium]
MFKFITSKKYWSEAAGRLGDLRVMLICSMCIALSVILGYFYIPINESLSVRFTYLATSTVGLVGGPVVALVLVQRLTWSTICSTPPMSFSLAIPSLRWSAR